MKSNSIIDSTNNAGTTGVFLGNVGGNTVWQSVPIPAPFTAQFAATVTRTYSGSNALVLDVSSFATGLTFTFSPPTFTVDVLQTGTYLCSYTVVFVGTSATASYTVSLERLIPTVVTVDSTTIVGLGGDETLITSTFICSLVAGETYLLRLAGPIPPDSFNVSKINLVFTTV
jgi:hypothetical protein